MMVLFILICQTIPLERVAHQGVANFETNAKGHFLYDRADRVFYWSLEGKLLKSFPNRQTIALYPINGGYALSWINSRSRTYGVDFISPTGRVVQNLPETICHWYFEVSGKLYGSPDIWSQNEHLIVPIMATGEGLFPSKSRAPFFRPADVTPYMPMSSDFKRVWIAEHDNGRVYIATPLTPYLYLYEEDRFISSKKMPIPWTGYQPFEKSNKPWREWAKTFNRLTHFGTASGRLVVGVDQLDGKTTKVYFLSPLSDSVISETTIEGWGRTGMMLSGTDGLHAWIFNPDTLSVTPKLE